MVRSILLASFTLLGLLPATAVHAQGLLWKLPEADGTWIRFEGDYTQVVNRPDAGEGKLNLSWKRWVTIKSVGKEVVTISFTVSRQESDGTFVTVEQERREDCRWIEIKVETGKTPEGVIDAGPGGIRIYKLLVPEAAIRGTVNEPWGDGREIFASRIPVRKGYRKLGDEPATPFAGTFDLYPVVSLLRHYRNLEAAGEAQTLGVGGASVSATPYRGSLQSETPTYRSVSTAELFRSEEMPFGVAKWTATVTTYQKGSTDPRSEYQETGIVKEELQAVTTGTGAESELLVD